MTIYVRTRALAASLLAAALAAVVTALLIIASPAKAVVAEVEVAPGKKVTFGMQPTNQSSVLDGTVGKRLRNYATEPETPTEEAEGEKEKEAHSIVFFQNKVAESFANATARPVLHGGSNIYAIYWDPQATYNPDWQFRVNGFLKNLGSSSGSLASVFAIVGQYSDSSNKPAANQMTFHGAYTDTHKFPAKGCTSPRKGALTCLTDAQLQEELSAFIAAHGLPKGMSSIYYLMTPPNVTVCLDAAGSRCSDFERSKKEVEESKYSSASYEKAICSYHSAINPGGSPTGDTNTVLYGAVPWTAGTAGQGTAATVSGQAAYCQDGGWNPSSKPIEERERVKPRNAQEQKEFLEKSPEEQEKLEQARVLQGPHNQEPNQEACPNLSDGLCDAGLADLIINQIAVEQQNIVTNPLLNAWQDEKGNEVTDECRNFFAPAQDGTATANPESGAGTLANQIYGDKHYYINEAFNFAAVLLPYSGVPCQHGSSLLPRFTNPNPVNSGEVVGFDGMESVVSLQIGTAFAEATSTHVYAKYKWEFGDGTPSVEGYAPGAPLCEAPWLSPCAGSYFHSYQYGGSYNVTLTITDIAGNSASVTHPVTVVGPPAPSVAGGGTGSSTPGGAGAPAPPQPPAAVTPTRSKLPAPVAAAAVASRALKSAVRKGLVVRYSVNEQVAGRFEVLLDRATARRLGIGGAPAVGLPAGSAPAVVIAKATVITTSGGRSTVSIQFSKRTASRLARMRRVSLLLRLVVRNADPHSPATTTVLSPVTLSR